VKDLLKEDNRVIGYLTGVSAFNKLGLTTQVSNTIQIGTNISKTSRRRGKYSIRFILQKNTITKDNINLLQILDSIRFIIRISDSNVSKSCRVIIALVSKLSESDLLTLTRLVMKYNPGTRALAGAIIDQVSASDITEPLLKSLNMVSLFSYNISDEVLDNKLEWRLSPVLV
jgi:hypothetical protein